MRKTLIAGLAALILGLMAVIGTPAHAGTGASTACPTTEVRTPITIGTGGPGNGTFMLCFSTAPNGAPGGEGGMIALSWAESTSTLTVTTTLTCDPDGPVWPTCNSGDGASAGSVGTSRSSTTYAQDSGGPCLWVLSTQELPTCTSAETVGVAQGDLPAVSGGVSPGGPPAGGQCLLQVGTTCYASLTGVKVTSGCDTTNRTVWIDTTYTGNKPLFDMPYEC